MTLTLVDIEQWDDQSVRDVSVALENRAGSMGNVERALNRLPINDTWSGQAADSATESLNDLAAYLAVNAAAHQQAAKVIGQAADEIEGLQELLQHVRDFAEGKFEIDLTTGAVTALSDDVSQDDQDYVVTTLAQIVAAGDAVDRELAHGLNLLDGVDPPGVPSTVPVDMNSERARNQREAFKTVYGRDPVSINDWRMAAGLDPHSYLPLVGGATPNIVVGRIDEKPGAGLVQTNAFIDTETADAIAFTNAGDNRGFNPTAMPDRSRVTFLVDYENGVVVARQNPSVKLETGEARAGTPEVSVGQESNGNVHINFNAADPYTPVLQENTKALGVSVDGDLYLQPTADGNVKVGGNVSAYPCWEVNHYAPDGTPTVLLQERPFVDHPLGLIAPSQTVGDTSVINGYHMVPALPGSELNPPGSPGHFPAAVPLGPPMISVPMQTTALGDASAPPTIPVIDRVFIPPVPMPR